MSIRNTGIVTAASFLFLVGSGNAFAESLPESIAAAEQQFGGEAFEAEIYGSGENRRVEVEVLSGNVIIEAVYKLSSGQLLESEAYGSMRRIDRVERALDVAQLSLTEARVIIEQWRRRYNERRPHSLQNYITPQMAYFRLTEMRRA